MNDQDTIEEIKQNIANHPVILFMKGSPQLPQCGFSAKVVEVLMSYGTKFSYVNVLEEPEVRRLLPQIAQWPTFPQLFVNEELVGGCDIIMDMHQNNELEAALKQAKPPAE